MIVNRKGIKTICKTIKKVHPNKDRDFYRMILSTELLRLLIDNEWTNQAVFEMHPHKQKRTEEARKFLKIKDMEVPWQSRVHMLAEWLYNLQNVDNIELLIEDIKAGNLTSRYAEIETARHFYSRKIDFEFVSPIGKKGKDFDIRIKTWKGFVNCEVKHKVEGNNLKARTFKDTLHNAKKQLPENQLGIISIKFPAEWTYNPSFTQHLNDSLQPFLKRNPKIIGILLRWEEWDKYNKFKYYWKYRFEKNIHFPFSVRIRRLIKRIESKEKRWISFTHLIDNYMS